MIEDSTQSRHNPTPEDGSLYRGVPDGLEHEFATCLDLLEQRGAAIFIVGQVNRPAIASCLRYLYGATDNVRGNVLTVTDGGPPGSYLPADTDRDNDRLRIFEYPLDRSASQASPSSTSPPTDRPDANTPELLNAVDKDLREAVWEMRSTGDQPQGPRQGHDPPPVRWSLTDLEPLLERSNHQDIAHWLATGPLSTVRQSCIQGRAHIACPRPADCDVIETLMAIPELFDVKVKLRREQGTVRQKWILPADRYPNLDPDDPRLEDRALETTWMTL